ncbi:MAG: hypothetical protein R3E79_09445 [Caldilineaceae bacterium]
MKKNRTEVGAALVFLAWVRKIMDDMGRQAQWLVSLRWQLRYAGLLAAVTQTDDRDCPHGLQSGALCLAASGCAW